ncbi:MAG: hypothetical protein MZV65_20625 [Chromatiales bacterium]|nr:hypothetical protein [Chromatiales bacterium]
MQRLRTAAINAGAHGRAHRDQQHGDQEDQREAGQENQGFDGGGEAGRRRDHGQRQDIVTHRFESPEPASAPTHLGDP